MRLLLEAMAMACALWSAPASAQPSLQDQNCAPMRWIGDAEQPRLALATQVRINRRSYWFQLDTGADATMLYGAEAVARGWTRDGAQVFTSQQLEAGGLGVADFPIHVRVGTKPGSGLAGTLGLDAFIGRVALIDYPGMRLCIALAYGPSNTIAERTHWSPASVRSGKLFVPVDVGDQTLENMFFDTGSSRMPLWVDLPDWTALTGVTEMAQAPEAIHGMQWGRPKVWRGAPARVPVRIGVGNTAVSNAIIYVDESEPNFFAHWPIPAEGNFGNALLWDHAVLLDLREGAMVFGIVD